MVRKSGKISLANKCAPARVDRGDIKLTCYSKDSLIKMAKSFNESLINGGRRRSGLENDGRWSSKRKKDKKGASGLVDNILFHDIGNNNNRESIPALSGGRIVYIGKSKKQIWDQLSKRLFNRCGDNEMCWKDQQFVKRLSDKEINEKTFKPKMPESWKHNPNEWLNTTNITNVMRQYEDVHEDFVYLGTVPRDCPMGVLCHLSGIDMKKLYKKHRVRRTGMVYNLDLHNQPGSHWVAVFMHFGQGVAIYFDSYADAPPKLILDFINSCMDQMKEIGVPMEMQVNQRRHQYGGSECGVYSCYFLIKSLEGVSLKRFSARRVADRKMTEMRRRLFIAG